MSISVLDTMDSFNFAILLLLKCNRRKRRKSHTFWVHPHQCFRMSKGSFNELLNVLEPHIRRQDTPMSATIPAEERLAMTLRYLLNVIY